MIIDYKNTKYKIYFKHIRKTPFTKKHLLWSFKDVVNNDLTICYIEDVFTKEIISQGLSKCSNEDRFVKEIGRQISLTRALMKIDDVELKYLITVEYFKNKSLKSEIAQIFTNNLGISPNYIKEEF